VVNQAVVRPAEAKMLNDTIKASVKAGLNFKGINAAGFASPDGEMGKNEKLADQRAEAAIKHVKGELVKNKAIAAKANVDSMVQKNATPEDWDGFKSMVSASSIAAKDKIMEITNGSSDPEAKEKEIRALPEYKEVSKDIMPKLRRADVKVSFQAREKTKEEIQRLAVSAPDSLSQEELIYGAALNEDPNAKLNIYKAYTQRFPDDWRGHNNIGYILLTQKNVSEAAPWIEKANTLSPNNPIVLNNLGVVARWRGDRKGAEDYYNQATAAGKEVTYNMGVLDVMKGNYTDALTKFGDVCSFNSSLANLLAGKPQDAMSMMECSDYKDTAIGYYLKAIISARTNNAEAVIANLKKAISADANLKSKAKIDLEFRNFRANADFKAIVE
jgi:Flp pilus assembly protein TadD